MSRQLTIPLDEILSLVSCAEDYGFSDDVLLVAFADMCDRSVSDEEIAAYAASFLTAESRAQGYGEEDAEAVALACTEWRDKYCKEP